MHGHMNIKEEHITVGRKREALCTIITNIDKTSSVTSLQVQILQEEPKYCRVYSYISYLCQSADDYRSAYFDHRT
jgi:hypothetical protein